jgi:hypothetical protein
MEKMICAYKILVGEHEGKRSGGRSSKLTLECMGLGAFAASELDKVFSGYQPR